jgi:hypothetical protein
VSTDGEVERYGNKYCSVGEMKYSELNSDRNYPNLFSLIFLI